MTTGVLLLLLWGPPAETPAPDVLFHRASKALNAGDLQAAERGFLQVLKSEPNSVPALGNLGVTYSRMERFGDAIRSFERALKIAPGQPGLLLNLAIAHVKREEYVAAKPLLEKLQPTPQVRQLRATCEIFTGDPVRALALLEGLAPSPELYFLSGTAHLRLRHKTEAQAAFRQLLSVAPAAQVHLLLGRAYADNTLFDDALPELRAAVAADPKSVPARLELAKTLISMRDNESAETELRAILAMNPVQPDAAYYLGALLVQQTKEDEALPLLERSRAARPDAWGAYYYLGRAWMGKHQPKTAIAMLERASKLNPDQGAVWFQLARAYQALGDADKARFARTRYTELSAKSLQRESQIIPPNR